MYLLNNIIEQITTKQVGPAVLIILSLQFCQGTITNVRIAVLQQVFLL